MEKEEIKREQLQDNIMKHIIFRLDYQGMVDSTDFVKEFIKDFAGFFGYYSKNTHNKVDIQLNDIEDISNTLSIPVSEIIKQDIHVFSKNSFGSDKVSLHISTYNTILNIECINYINIDEYSNFMKMYMSFLFKQEKYLVLKRFGLRKIGSNIYKNFNEIHQDFEKEYFGFKENYFNGFSLFRNRIEEVLSNDESLIKINFVRNLDSGNIIEVNNTEPVKAYQISLDLDAYLDEEALNKNSYKESFPDLITFINNEILFNVFKNSVTKEFLLKNVNRNEK